MKSLDCVFLTGIQNVKSVPYHQVCQNEVKCILTEKEQVIKSNFDREKSSNSKKKDKL